jgi:hypothetical protein
MSIASIAAVGVPAVLELLKALTPQLSTAGSGIIATAVNVIATYSPIVIAEYQALKPIVVDAINALAANPDTMPEQIKKLREVSKQYDAEFAAALARARAEDAADGD